MIWPFKRKKLVLVGFVSGRDCYGHHYWALYKVADTGKRIFKQIAGNKGVNSVNDETLKLILLWKYGGPLPKLIEVGE